MNQGPLIEEDYSLYKQLVDLWQKENPIKTNKLQVLLVVNGLLLTAVNLSGGFLPKNWPIYLGGAFFSLVWVISIGRTSLFQKIWEIKIKSLAERHSQDARFQVLDYRQAIKETPGWLRFFGGVSSKYYLIGAPFLFCMVWFLILVYFLTFAAAGPPAAPVSKTIRYSHAGEEFVGYLAYDAALPGKRPGVLVVHEWWGLNEFAKQQADKLAAMGYMALAVDMYGRGLVTSDPQEAARLAGQVRGTPLIRERALAGMEVLAEHELTDPNRLAAIGFCFGGTTALELAYSGADLRGVASFHGGLTAPRPEDMQNLKAGFLILHGADDPLVKPEEIAAFQEAMRQAGTDWQMIYYGGAVHSFTNPAAGSDKSKGSAYDATAAARSWEHLRLFLEDIFSP